METRAHRFRDGTSDPTARERLGQFWLGAVRVMLARRIGLGERIEGPRSAWAARSVAVLLALLAGCSAAGNGPECHWETLVVDPELQLVGAGAEAFENATTVEVLAAARVELEADGEEAALEVLAEGLQSDPSSPELLSFRGELLADSGFRRAAERDYQRAVKAAPERAELWRALGEVQLQLELPAAANEALRRCNSLEPDDPQTLVLLARASRQCGQLERAAHLYGKALADPRATACMLVEGASLYGEERMRRHYPEQVEEAFRWVSRALALEPKHPRAHFVRGLLLEGEGKFENALACYRRSIEIDPYCLGAYTNLALLCAESGEETLAQEMALKAIALEENPHRRRALRELFENPSNATLVATLRE